MSGVPSVGRPKGGTEKGLDAKSGWDTDCPKGKDPTTEDDSVEWVSKVAKPCVRGAVNWNSGTRVAVTETDSVIGSGLAKVCRRPEMSGVELPSACD